MRCACQRSRNFFCSETYSWSFRHEPAVHEKRHPPLAHAPCADPYGPPRRAGDVRSHRADARHQPGGGATDHGAAEERRLREFGEGPSRRLAAGQAVGGHHLAGYPPGAGSVLDLRHRPVYRSSGMPGRAGGQRSARRGVRGGAGVAPGAPGERHAGAVGERVRAPLSAC